MAINLNKEYVTKKNVLKETTDLDIYRFYTEKDVQLDNPIISPLGGDKKPSFGYFLGRNNEICFNDFRFGGGDCIKFVQIKYGLNFFDALSKIAIDFRFDDKYIVKQLDREVKDISKTNWKDREDLLKTASSFRLGKSSRKWNTKDLAFWYSYAITKPTLDEYNVTAINYLFINDTPILMSKYAYCFTEYKDRKFTHKIYQPFSTKYKWLNNHDNSVWQGWSQLPQKGDTLIITKSLKDVMAIKDVLGIPAVSLQAEGVKPKTKIINELKERFDNILIFYDNDFDKEINWGRQFGKEFSKKYEFCQVEIPDKYQCKDFSDLVKKYGKDRSKTIWNNVINYPY